VPATPNTPTIQYQQIGSKGPRVLLVMGLGMRGEVWKPQIDGLVDHCQLLYFDNRGIGDSDNIGEFLSMQDMARDALRVLDSAGWGEDVHLVGVSMGGMISQELALFRQERFASLTLIATHPGGPTSWLPPALGIARFLAVQLGPQDKRTEAMAKLLYPKNFLESCDREQLHERMRFQIGSRPNRHTMRKQLAAIRRHDTRQRLGQLYLPTLIIKPELDILVNPQHSERLKRGIKHASMMVLPDAGHGVVFQSAQQVNDRLLAHFSSAAARPEAQAKQ
jgi:pimeloyl-ACP methyl ester carboxylesterase